MCRSRSKAIDRFAMETKRQLDVLDHQLPDREYMALHHSRALESRATGHVGHQSSNAQTFLIK
jgi:hypothetical protein